MGRGERGCHGRTLGGGCPGGPDACYRVKKGGCGKLVQIRNAMRKWPILRLLGVVQGQKRGGLGGTWREAGERQTGGEGEEKGMEGLRGRGPEGRGTDWLEEGSWGTGRGDVWGRHHGGSGWTWRPKDGHRVSRSQWKKVLGTSHVRGWVGCGGTS